MKPSDSSSQTLSPPSPPNADSSASTTQNTCSNDAPRVSLSDDPAKMNDQDLARWVELVMEKYRKVKP